jgi:hypothetical protein
VDECSPSKIKALKASNGTNGDAPTVVHDDSSNHKNGDEHYHDEEDDDDDEVCFNKRFIEKSILFFFLGS